MGKFLYKLLVILAVKGLQKAPALVSNHIGDLDLFGVEFVDIYNFFGGNRTRLQDATTACRGETSLDTFSPLAEVETMDTTYCQILAGRQRHTLLLSLLPVRFVDIHAKSLTLVLISVIFTALFPTVTMFTCIISAAIPWDSLSESNLERMSIHLIKSILRYTQ